MIRVQFRDGLAVQGETYEDVVRGMLEKSFEKTDEKDVLEEMKNWAEARTGQPIKFQDSESFIEELKRVNLIRSVEKEH
ncbi:hypothetical protein GTO91_10135 [Heliobacterium undosum]|uniref:Uncharacterized protein n=1 Tax=Heliomicrobium undosum TaxID=121734 RepID=A0A845L5E3_9FIRM|nr:hypothetical protein [Heliomicrobium undosum]MZP30064.1 hypothetical protein [Heliomicrobium undosum]